MCGLKIVWRGMVLGLWQIEFQVLECLADKSTNSGGQALLYWTRFQDKQDFRRLRRQFSFCSS